MTTTATTTTTTTTAAPPFPARSAFAGRLRPFVGGGQRRVRRVAAGCRRFVAAFVGGRITAGNVGSGHLERSLEDAGAEAPFGSIAIFGGLSPAADVPRVVRLRLLVARIDGFLILGVAVGDGDVGLLDRLRVGGRRFAATRGRVVVLLVVDQRLLHRLGAVVDVDPGAALDHVVEHEVRASVGRQHVADVQEAVDPPTERDEGRADAGLDVDDPALVDVTEIRLSVGQLDVQLLQHAVLDHRDPALFRIDGVDEHPLHDCPSVGVRRRQHRRRPARTRRARDRRATTAPYRAAGRVRERTHAGPKAIRTSARKRHWASLRQTNGFWPWQAWRVRKATRRPCGRRLRASLTPGKWRDSRGRRRPAQRRSDVGPGPAISRRCRRCGRVPGRGSTGGRAPAPRAPAASTAPCLPSCGSRRA